MRPRRSHRSNHLNRITDVASMALFSPQTDGFGKPDWISMGFPGHPLGRNVAFIRRYRTILWHRSVWRQPEG